MIINDRERFFLNKLPVFKFLKNKIITATDQTTVVTTAKMVF